MVLEDEKTNGEDAEIDETTRKDLEYYKMWLKAVAKFEKIDSNFKL